MKQSRKQLFDVIARIEKTLDQSTAVTLVLIDAQTGEIIKRTPSTSEEGGLTITVRI